MHFRTLGTFFEFYLASQRPRSHLKTFLEPVASFSQSMSPFRATPPPFMPKSIKSPYTPSPENSPFTPNQDVPYCPHNNSFFQDPSRLVAKVWVYRNFVTLIFSIVCLTSYGNFRRKSLPNTRFQGWTLLGYIVRTILCKNNYSKNLKLL